MKPKYTDAHRFPHGYTRSESTDIRKTFERARARQKQATAERADKVRPIQPKRRSEP